jgi:uracil-DNA glycosylase
MYPSKPILFVGEAKGEAEAKLGVDFVGPSGIELLRMLNESGVIEFTHSDTEYIRRYYSSGDSRHIDNIWRLHADEVRRTNVFSEHPPGNKLEHFCGSKAEGIPGFPALLPSKYVHRRYVSELDRLGDEIISLDPNLIVALGNSALWALCGRTGIAKLRGTTCISTHTVAGYKLLCAYHPAAVIRQWELRPTTVADLSKAVLQREFPDVRRPPCEIWIEPDLDDIESFFHTYCQTGTLISCDIETSGTRITCMGFAPRRDLAIVIPFDDARKPGKSYWPTADSERRCWELIRTVLEDRGIGKVFQNGLYDIAFLLRSYGIRTFGAQHDTMLLHHALQPEALKGLGYLGSMYTDHGPWKSERKSTETIKRDE